MSERIGVREFRNQVSRLLRSVREDMAEYVITLHGDPIAVLRPLTGEEIDELRQAQTEEGLAQMKSLAQQVAAAWISPKSGVELISEQRR
jgi:prevent-host-death family protein